MTSFVQNSKLTLDACVSTQLVTTKESLHCGLDSEKKKKLATQRHPWLPTVARRGTLIRPWLSASLDVTVHLIDLYLPLLLSYSVLYDTVSLSQHLGTDHLFPMDAHVVASILGSWLSEATAAEADLCVPCVAQSSQTGRVSAATRLKAAPSSSQKDANGARKF